MSTTTELQRLRDSIADRIHQIAQGHVHANGVTLNRQQVIAELTQLEGQIRGGEL